jgi:lactoylglutathione lyase
MTITQIGSVSIYVESQKESLSFWVDKVGLEVRANHPMTEQDSWIELAPKGAESSLVIYPRSMMPNWKEMKPSVIFLCDDVSDTVSRLNTNGVKITKQPEKMSWGTYATFADIDGNEFLLKEKSTV